MEPDSFIGLLAKWLFGIDPSSITWIHVSLAFVMSSFGWGPFVVKYLWYRQHMRFLTTATGPQLEAYRSNPPQPPTMAGPLFVFWFLLGVGFLSAAGRAGALADESISAKSPCPGGCPAGSTCNPKTRSCEATATKPLPIPSAPKSRSMESTITKAAPLGAELDRDRYYEVNASPADYFDGSPES